MSVLISQSYRFIFIHVHKAGGTSVSHALLPYCFPPHESIFTMAARKLGLAPDFRRFDPHIKARDLRAALPSKKWTEFYKFAVVRNPWEWHVSQYSFIRNRPDHANHGLVSRMKNFAEYIEWRCGEGKYLQSDFVCDEAGNLLVDRLLRFDHLKLEFTELCDKLQIEASLPRMNVTEHEPAGHYYTPETIEMVAEAYRPDIQLMNFQPPKPDGKAAP